jgi:hypothetical protein
MKTWASARVFGLPWAGIGSRRRSKELSLQISRLGKIIVFDESAGRGVGQGRLGRGRILALPP